MITWEFHHLEFRGSSNGHAELVLRAGRKNRKGKYVRREDRLIITRDDLRTLCEALTTFANRERASVQTLPL